MKFYFEREYKETSLEWFAVEAETLEEAEHKIRNYEFEPKEQETIDSECVGFYRTRVGSRERIKELEL